MKVCVTCGKEKDDKYFYRYRGTKLYKRCKRCQIIYNAHRKRMRLHLPHP